MRPLRIGLLGAARISDLAVVAPAHDAGHRLVAVAARDPERARRWAEERQIERVVASYAELVNDPEVDVVYNPLPNSLHAPWNIAAIEAGNHLLTEKPFASNAVEAATVRDAAAARNQVVFEGFHYRYHPIFKRLLEVSADGTIGRLTDLRVSMSMPAPGEDDLRWSRRLAGGALMDLGCYAIHLIRTFAQQQAGVPELISASAVERSGRPQVDESAHLQFRLPGGAGAVADVTMDGPWEFTVTALGSTGSATVCNFVNVHHDDRLILRTLEGERVEHFGLRSTYHYQMDALVAAIAEGQPFPTGPDEAVAYMQMIDACYLASGLQPREGDAGQLAADGQRGRMGGYR
jgi:predicted dehydrogenase